MRVVSAEQFHRDSGCTTIVSPSSGVFRPCFGKRVCDDCPLSLNPNSVVYCNGAPKEAREIIDGFVLEVDEDAATTEG